MGIKLTQWIVEADIVQLQQGMETGLFSAEQLAEAYVERINQYDRMIRSVVEINPDALAIARELDRERRVQGIRGMLHGIPILLKDNIDTQDNMHTSAGTLALADSYAANDSFVASQLRKAGAVLLGKTNMTEWANFMSSTMWSGYSARGGQTLNPYGPGELDVGGSSSGSAAAVSSNLAAAAIGTETAGSIINPASQNGIVGIKPTVGLISRSGIIPISSTQDTAGPMTRTVSDAAILLGALTGEDDNDPATALSRGLAYKDYTPFLDALYLGQATIGIPRELYEGVDEEGLAIVEEAIAVLREQGAVVIDPVLLPQKDYDWDYEVLRHEFKKGVNDYLAQLGEHAPVHSLQEVIAFNEQHAERSMKYGQDTLIWSEETSGTLTDKAYLDSLSKDRKLSRELGLDYLLRTYELDALLFHGTYDKDFTAKAGYPLITVPAGYAAVGTVDSEGYTTKGPRGITFSGGAFSEPTLIKIAYGFEQATRKRTPPILTGGKHHC